MLDFTKYKSYKYDIFHTMNKLKFPITHFTWFDYEEFNEIYMWARENCMEGHKTPSGGIKGGFYNKYKNFYFVIEKKASIELVLCHLEYGCFRFIVNQKKSKENTISGQQALRTIYKTAQQFGVLDEFKKESVDKEQGKVIKSEIESPVITLVSTMYRGNEFEHCYHLDLNSSYASRISEKYPKLKPMYEWLYNNRKANNDLFKHVLTNSVGAMQSEYCIDINNNEKYSLYQLSTFAKIAVNGTNDKIAELCFKLVREGFKPLLINTDGIWYTGKGKAYHDEDEGTSLGQWKNDHKDVKLYIKSAGSYQYIENGKVHTVYRGTCSLDKIKPDRDTWEWREIDNYKGITFEFNKDRGIVANE